MRSHKVKLGDVFLLLRNGANIKQTGGLGGIPITRIETIANGIVDLKRVGYGNIYEGEYNEYLIENGDILMSHINSWSHLGKSALVKIGKQKVIHGMNLLLLRSDRSKLIPQYAQYFFSTTQFKSQLYRISNQSVNQSSFAVTKLKELLIPLPSLRIQKQIATFTHKEVAFL